MANMALAAMTEAARLPEDQCQRIRSINLEEAGGPGSWSLSWRRGHGHSRPRSRPRTRARRPQAAGAGRAAARAGGLRDSP